jgi:hypothetical protein
MGLGDWFLCNEVLDDTIRDTPSDEVQLGDGRRQFLAGGELVLDTLCTAERIEQLFRIPV